MFCWSSFSNGRSFDGFPVDEANDLVIESSVAVVFGRIALFPTVILFILMLLFELELICGEPVVVSVFIEAVFIADAAETPYTAAAVCGPDAADVVALLDGCIVKVQSLPSLLLELAVDLSFTTTLSPVLFKGIVAGCKFESLFTTDAANEEDEETERCEQGIGWDEESAVDDEEIVSADDENCSTRGANEVDEVLNDDDNREND